MGTTRSTEQLEAVAHVLRRTSFGPYPGQVQDALDRHGSATGVVAAQLAAAPLPFVGPTKIDEPFDLHDKGTDPLSLMEGWIGRMRHPDAGLHEKMTWFWHTHFTTGLTKATSLYGWRQLRLLHSHALGNFRDLAKAITVDAAMLQWLDGAGSLAHAPNENYARELMELFTMGRGNYSESDVRAGARALAGWFVGLDERAAYRVPGTELTEPVTFLGVTAVHTPDSVVDRILEQPATAPFVTRRIAGFFLGDTVEPAQLDAWAADFRSSDYEVRPLVAAILQSDAFMGSRRARGRTGIEWYCTVLECAQIDRVDTAAVQGFAQVPYQPVNVAGWPDRWLTSSSLYARAAYLSSALVGDVDLGADRAGGAFERCSIFDPSPATAAAVGELAATDADDRDVLRAALSSPEFALS